MIEVLAQERGHYRPLSLFRIRQRHPGMLQFE